MTPFGPNLSFSKFISIQKPIKCFFFAGSRGEGEGEGGNKTEGPPVGLWLPAGVDVESCVVLRPTESGPEPKNAQGRDAKRGKLFSPLAALSLNRLGALEGKRHHVALAGATLSEGKLVASVIAEAFPSV